MNNESKRMCPKCKSDNVNIDWSAEATFSGQSTVKNFKCNKCGYAGIFFPEVDKKFKK